MRQQRAVLFLNRGGLGANPFGKDVDGADEERYDRKREQRQLPIESQHDSKGADQGNAGSDNVSEAFIVNCLNGLRIVSDAKTGISRAPRVVKLERKPL